MGRHIVTVARQFGCGGGEIAKKLAELLSVEYFDKELLEKAAEASGISKDAFERADERAASSFLYSLAMSSYSGHISPVGVNDVMLSDKLFTVQSDAIRKLAAEKDCVIVGRCADDLLSSYEGLTRIFIHAPLEYRLAVVMERHQLSESSARTLIRKTDKKRASTTISTPARIGALRRTTTSPSTPPYSVWTKQPRCWKTSCLRGAETDKKDGQQIGGRHKTIIRHSDWVCCAECCIFRGYTIEYKQFNKTEFVCNRKN